MEVLTCPICGKKFCVWDEEIYQWKFKEDIFCSYTCMRTVEKKYLDSERLFAEEGIKKQKLPQEYREVYGDLIRLRKLSRMVGSINIIKSRYELNKQNNTKIQRLYRKCLYYMRKIRCKYVDGIERLNIKQLKILSMYVIQFTDIEDISEDLGITYKDIIDNFIDIMKILEENKSNQTKRNRWDIVKC